MCDDRDEFLLSAGSVIQTHKTLVLKISKSIFGKIWEIIIITPWHLIMTATWKHHAVDDTQSIIDSNDPKC